MQYSFAKFWWAQTFLLLVAISALSFAVGVAAADESDHSLNQEFDPQHAELALHYFENPVGRILGEMAATDAARHLKRHSDRTGYYPADTTTYMMTLDLLGLGSGPQTPIIGGARGVMAHIAERPDRQASCRTDAAVLLPPGAKTDAPVFLTWGYDIGVATDRGASLNVSHPRFLANPDEVWYFCTHELHHTGVISLHPFPNVRSIDTFGDLQALVRYLTFLEGTAVYATLKPRTDHDALAADPDVAVLTGDTGHLQDLLRAYEGLVADLNAEDPERPLSDEDLQIINAFSSGDRLWYVYGAFMAKTIDDNAGHDALLRAIETGPDAYFTAFQDLRGDR